MTIELNKGKIISMSRAGVLDSMCKLIQQDLTDEIVIDGGLMAIQNYLDFGARMSRKEATNDKHLIKVKQRSTLNRIKKLRRSQNSEVWKQAFGILNKYLKEPILRKKLRLKRAIICFRNERHSLFGLFQNRKKKLCV